MTIAIREDRITFPDDTFQTSASPWALEAEYDFNTLSAAASVDVSWDVGFDYKQVKYVLQDVQFSSDGGYICIRFGTGTTANTYGYNCNIRFPTSSGLYVYTNQNYGRLVSSPLGGYNNETHNGEIIVHTGVGVGKAHGCESKLEITTTANQPFFTDTLISHNIGYDSTNPMNFVTLFNISGYNFDRGIVQVWTMS